MRPVATESLADLRLFMDCQMRFFLSHEEQILPPGQPREDKLREAVRTACARHGAAPLETIAATAIAWEFGALSPDDTSPAAYSAQRAHAMYEAWAARWAAADHPLAALEVVEGAEAFDLRIGYLDRPWLARGERDGIVQLPDGRLALLRRWITGESIGPDDDLTHRLRLDLEAQLHAASALHDEHEVEVIVFDVLRKPSLHPHPANTEVLAEPPQDYRKRVLNELARAPATYFTRFEVPLTRQTKRPLSSIADRALEDLERARRGRFWWKNTAACTRRGSTCPYLRICSAGEYRQADPLPPGWSRAGVENDSEPNKPNTAPPEETETCTKTT